MEIDYEGDFGRNYLNVRKKRKKSYPKEIEIKDNYSHLRRGESVEEERRFAL